MEYDDGGDDALLNDHVNALPLNDCVRAYANEYGNRDHDDHDLALNVRAYGPSKRAL